MKNDFYPPVYCNTQSNAIFILTISSAVFLTCYLLHLILQQNNVMALISKVINANKALLMPLEPYQCQQSPVNASRALSIEPCPNIIHSNSHLCTEVFVK